MPDSPAALGEIWAMLDHIDFGSKATVYSRPRFGCGLSRALQWPRSPSGWGTAATASFRRRSARNSA